MFFSSKRVYFIALSLLLTFAHRITSFTNIIIFNKRRPLTPKNVISAAALKRVNTVILLFCWMFCSMNFVKTL